MTLQKSPMQWPHEAANWHVETSETTDFAFGAQVLAFSPDGSWLVWSVGGEEPIRGWHRVAGKTVSLGEGGGYCTDIVFDADGRSFLAAWMGDDAGSLDRTFMNQVPRTGADPIEAQNLESRLLADEVDHHVLEELLARKAREDKDRPPSFISGAWRNLVVRLSCSRAGLFSAVWQAAISEVVVSRHDASTLEVVWSKSFVCDADDDGSEQPHVVFIEPQSLLVTSLPDGSVAWVDPTNQARSGRKHVGKRIHGLAVDVTGQLWIHADTTVRSMRLEG